MNASTAPCDPTGELTCRQLIELLYDFVEGGLAADIEGYCRQHLDECPDCRDYLASYLTTRRLSRESGQGPAADEPEELLEQILAAVAGAHHLNRQENAP